ncbi:acyl-coenzyme A amino acid N-acyltransferase 2-like [Rhinoderma darwinii]|uniref:acyl-coenzyme A amino acid N-acyltransferase 2-like n=1 Tax=Rhinoderma darwinii TaxID=43563 RepID=UPI003F66EB00
MMTLKASPEISLVDEAVKIQVWGLEPQQIITLRAWLKDERGKLFHSKAYYVSDMEGKVDLEHSPATGGDFHGVCPMGLFWALKSSIPFLRLLKRDVMGSPFNVHLELYCYLELNALPEKPPATTTCVERWYVSPGVQRLQIKQGRIRGALFIPPGEGPFPGVIDIFGAIGGLIEFRSSLLASRGIASLALAYYGYDDLPKTLDHVDLKYFEEAAHLLINHPKVSRAGVGLVGVSKGAEIALALSCFVPKIVATICINGRLSVTSHTFSYGELILKGAPPRLEKSVTTSSGSLVLLKIYGDLEDQDFILPIEKAKSPILFLAGENDQMCDSVLNAKVSIARAQKYGKKDVYLRSYPGAGHLLEPGSPFCPVSLSSNFNILVQWGGELLGHCKAQEISWRETLDFFRTYIPCSQQSKI